MTKDKDIWKNRYEQIAKDPIIWLSTATTLIHNANMLLLKEEDGPLKGTYLNTGTFMMLTSYAIENIIKSIIIIKDNSLIKDGIMHKKLAIHDLLNLSQTAGITNYNKHEEYLLNRLSTFAIYAGKYPIPKTWHIYKDSLCKKGSGKRETIFMTRDFNDIINIINKLQGELNNLGLIYDIYDMSYTYTKNGKSIHIKKRIQPHQHPSNKESI